MHKASQLDFVFLSVKSKYESYPVITTLVRKQWKNIFMPPFQFDHLLTQVASIFLHQLNPLG